MPPDDASALEPTLERAKKKLKGALDEACTSDLEHADTGELIRIEEVLAIANEAAKEAVSVRRRLRSQHPAGAAGGTREIEDARGVKWSAFAVHPSQQSGRAALRERYREGWLSFDSGDETRRIAPIPDGWRGLPDADLIALCEQAEPAPRRLGHGGAGGTSDSGPTTPLAGP
ncbi:MAG: hypothetical protein ACHQWU_14025 [Gemmatimonadales bacterium]|jgi:hypothetical protein